MLDSLDLLPLYFGKKGFIPRVILSIGGENA